MGSETNDVGSRLGLTLAPAGDVDGPGSKGVAVMAVDPNGPAAEHGFQIGDRILDVAGKEVSTPADIRKDLAELRKAGSIRAYAGEIPRCGQVRCAAARVRRMGMLRAPGLPGATLRGPPGNRTYRHRGTTAGDRAGSRNCPPKIFDQESCPQKAWHASTGRTSSIAASCRCLAVRADDDRVEKGDILHRASSAGMTLRAKVAARS